jgi:hypothetical protein
MSNSRKLSIENSTGKGRTRRELLRMIAAGTASLGSTSIVGSVALAQNPPQCPTSPPAGTLFRPGQDTRPIVQRKPISALSSWEVKQLRNAFKALRALPSTDNRTWALQGDLHALYCGACNVNAGQIHGSWSFFPWHRAFLYYYERILGSLVGNLDGFRLPYWEWQTQRSLASPYRSPASSYNNALWDPNRDAVIENGGSLPANDGTSARVALLNKITDFATFGGTASSGGACESDPHNPVHVDVGLKTSPYLDMGNLGYAARDPIFVSHHCNIDKLWSNWNALKGTSTASGAYENPTDPAFVSQTWSFYDEHGNAVSMSVADALNHQNNLRYSYPGPATASAATALSTSASVQSSSLETVPVRSYSGKLVPSDAIRDGARLDVNDAVRSTLLQALDQKATVLVIFKGVTVPQNVRGVFDITVPRSRNTKVGVIAVVDTGMMMSQPAQTLLLDVTTVAKDLLNPTNPGSFAVIRRNGRDGFRLQAQSAEFRVLQ